MKSSLLLLLLMTIVATTATMMASSSPLPPGTPQTRGIRNLVLSYIDSRSTGPHPSNNISVENYQKLILSPMGTKMFDAFQIIGYAWKDEKCFWPGQCKVPMDVQDWLEIQSLWEREGIEKINEAAAAASASAKNTTTSVIKLVVSIMYPDQRQTNFGRISSNGPSLNFTKESDRIAAVKSWVKNITDFFAANKHRLQNVELVGFYWFLEIMKADDVAVTRATSEYIHSLDAPSPSSSSVPRLSLSWIPYYDACLSPLFGVSHWKHYGFDFCSIQPNFAFQRVEPSVRFKAVDELVEKFATGVELELPLYSRNPAIHDNFTESFYDYLAAAKQYRWDERAFMSFYYANAFAEMASTSNQTEHDMYLALARLLRERN